MRPEPQTLTVLVAITTIMFRAAAVRAFVPAASHRGTAGASIAAPAARTLCRRAFASSSFGPAAVLGCRFMSAVDEQEKSEAASAPPQGYPFAEVEAKWQAYWEKKQTFKTLERDLAKPKKYVLDMFPYPSGAGLHVGHPEGYTGKFCLVPFLSRFHSLNRFPVHSSDSNPSPPPHTHIQFFHEASDVMARYWRMTGNDVLHPIGWDSFGLPAEQFAINTGAKPAVTTAANIANFKRQLKMLGFSYDWDREIATTDVDYVKWTQWIFLQLYSKGLAEQSEVSVNWCPALGTVLANEEVINGLSERGDHPVLRFPLRQWQLKITDYADRLEAGLEGLDWPSGTLTAQKQWIGKSEGCDIDFGVDGMEDQVSIAMTSCVPALFVVPCWTDR